ATGTIERDEKAQRISLRKRVRLFYRHFAGKAWAKCFATIDPKLREASKVSAGTYAESLSQFADSYGPIDIWHIDIHLHLDAAKNKQDPRPFAYVYLFWQDSRYQFHVFRERWVHDSGKWYTRVVGLVTREKNGESRQA